MNEQVKAEVKKSLAVLKNGGVILYPTDTVWGLGCDATNPEAVRKIYEIKKRADSKTMILLVDLEARLSTYVKEIPEAKAKVIHYTHSGKVTGDNTQVVGYLSALVYR